MKKRRIVALALATSMAFSSFSSATFAEENVSTVDETADVVDTEVVDDAETSDAALVANADEDGTFLRGGLVTNVPEEGDWMATVTGDAGGADNVSGNTFYNEGTGDNAKYNGSTFYEVVDKGTRVHMRMGLFDDKGSVLKAVGKIASGTDGLTMYYKKLDVSDDFEMSAHVDVSQLDNSDNQVSFGLAVRDIMKPMTNDGGGRTGTGNMFAVGPVQMKNLGNSGNGMLKSYIRDGKTMLTSTTYPQFMNEATVKPQVGDSFDFKIRKHGDVYILFYDDQDPVEITPDMMKFSDDIYVGPYVSRAAAVDFSNIQFKNLETNYSSIKVVQAPEKTTYVVGSELDTTGLRVEATLPDGSTKILSEDEYDVIGYNTVKGEAGDHEVTVVCGNNSASFNVTVEPLKVTNLTVNYPTAKKTFYVGTKFSNVGLVVTAEYNDGTKEIIDSSKYVLTMDGKVLDDSVYLTDDMIGSKTVTVAYTDTNPNVDANGKSTQFNISIVAATTDELLLSALPVKTVYYLGEEFKSAGILVSCSYTVNGEVKYQSLLDSEYTITGFDSSKPAENQVITITLNRDPSKTTSFNITVKERRAVDAELSTYPRTTFHVNEMFDASDMIASTIYDSEDVEEMNLDENGEKLPIYYFDGASYYTLTAPNDEAVKNEKGVYAATEAQAKAADFYIDLSNYDNSKVGETEASVIFRDFNDVKLRVTITESESYIWKPGIFGASSMGFPDQNPPTGPAEIYVNDVLVDGNTYDQSVGRMEDGKLTNVNKVRLNAWDKAGKTSTGVDGIAYYYTRIDANKNFTVSADIKINRYIVDPDDEATQTEMEKTKADAEALLGRTVTKEEVIDMSRDGQENFGIQAMDAIALFAKDGLGDDNLITADASKAQLDQYGEPVNMLEAYLKGMSAVDYRGDRRQVTDTNVSAGFASNLVLAGGYSGATYSRDITATNYYKNTHLNRINLMVKKGIVDYMISTGGQRMDPYPTTDTVPMKGEQYNITLQKINYGYKITTYNYQTGETRTNYSFTSTDSLQNLLVTQADTDNVWVGFHAARWADIDISNIRLYETSPETDPVISKLTEETYSPSITVQSALYTSTSDYKLALKANNRSGGYITVYQNDVEVYTDAPVARKVTTYPVTLEPNSKTNFTVVYSPSHVDNCVSYEPVVLRFVVTNKELDRERDNIYVSPTGSVKTGDGSRENPIDLESAVGLAEIGQKVVMLDGTYNISDKIVIPLTSSGIATGRKYLVADEGAHPVIDLRKLTGGFQIAADYWEFDGIEICNAAGNTKSFELGGNHVTVKNCTFHDNGDTGLQISRVGDGDTIEDWPGYNLVLDCESYNNADPSKNNADGFAAKLTSGYGNIFKGCISHHNVDDGWDLYTKIATGPIGLVTLEDCVAYAQGYELYEDGTDGIWGDPDGCNGFKTGGENISVMHYLKDCIAFDNIGSGIESNFNPALKARNVVCYNNQKYNVALYTNSPKDYNYDMKGVISYKGYKGDRIGTVSYDENVTYENASTNVLLSPSNYFIYGFGYTNPGDKIEKQEGLAAAYADEATFNEHFGFKNYVDNGSKITYSALKDLAAKNGVDGADLNSYNSDLEMIDDSFFKSVDSSEVLVNGRYVRNEDGSFARGDFLVRSTPYVHDPDDAVNYSKVTYPDDVTEETTEVVENTETTTVRRPSPNGGGGGGSSTSTSGNSSKKGSSVAEATTADADTEQTTSVPVKANSFVTPSGVVITPPVATGVRVNFTDIANRAWAVESINKLAAAGIVNGVSSDKFAPDAYSKRADFIVMLVKTFGLTGPATDNFDDVEAGKYYADALAVAKTAGIATGYGDGNFGPEKTITRQDMMVLVAKALEFAGIELDTDTAVLDSFADADKIADYAKPYVAALANNGFATGTDNGIEPTALITRAQMSVLVAKVYDVVLAAAEEAAEAEEETTVEELTEETTAEAEEETVEDTTVEEETVEETTEAE